jgi:hypothetical protein
VSTVTKGNIQSFAGTRFKVDYTVEGLIEGVDAFGSPTNTTPLLLIDSGTSGLYVSTLAGGYAGTGVRIQFTENTSTSLGPKYLFFDKLISDTCATDCLYFDSSLNSGEAGYFTFTNSWFAGATNNGVHISGGMGITITGGTKIRSNLQNGVLIDGNSSYLTISDSFITANNVSNTSGDSGILDTYGSVELNIRGNIIGNVIDTNGHQAYGLSRTGVTGSNMVVIGNDLRGNVTGGLNGNTSGDNIIGNLGTITNSIQGYAEIDPRTGNSISFIVHNIAQTHNNFIVFDNGMVQSVDNTLDDGSGNLAVSNHLNQTATGKFAGTCTMTATTCTLTIAAAYNSTPGCLVT